MTKGPPGWHRVDRGNRPAADDQAAMARRAVHAPAPRPDPGASWRSAASSLTAPASPAPNSSKRVKKTGGNGRGMARFAAQKIADDYVALCKNPAKDLKRWLAEDKKRPVGKGRRFQSTITNQREDHDQIANQTRNEKTSGLCGDALPTVRNGMDAQGGKGRRSHGVLARSRSRLGRYDALRQVRGEGPVAAGAEHRATNAHARTRAGPGRYDVLRLVRTPHNASNERGTASAAGHGSNAAPDLSHLGAERSAIRSLYAAKIEIMRRSLPRHEIAVAIRALRDEQRAATRALTVRKQSTLRAWRERRDAERFSAKQSGQTERAQETARAPPEAKPS